jgi:DNA repair exonuclease SbcCD ATPase subunit
VNLERIYLENYKQFREPAELLPPEGAIGVVGPNGAGKSTLFESILWAFFGSRGGGPRFANEMIPWSGGTSKDPSIAEVTLAVGGRSYTVQRQLKGSATTAEARDESGKTIVTGSSDVARWVEGELLRMDRAAFEATFYAKQKELRFFAQDDGISRVRKISKMLGINRVETAQTLLRSDRNDLRAQARALESQLADVDEEELKERLAEHKEECRRLEVELDKISAEYEAARSEVEEAGKARAALDTANREHTRLTNALREAEGERTRAEDRAKEAEKDLAELVAAGKELARLRPEAARLPELEEDLEKLEETRRLAEDRTRKREELRETQAAIACIERELSTILEELDGAGEPLEGWTALFDLDGTEQLVAAVEVFGRAGNELEKAEERLTRLKELAELHEEYRLAAEELCEAREKEEAARREAEKLAEELEYLSGGEDLELRERELSDQEEKLRELAAARRGAAAADEREAKNVDKARYAVESGAEEHCPTCHRGFEDGEYDEIVDTLNRQAAALRRRAARETTEAEKHLANAERTAEKLDKVSGKLRRWRELREDLARAETVAADRREALDRARTRTENSEARLDGAPAPTEESREELDALCLRLRRLRDALPGVRSMAREHAGLVERCEGLFGELEELAKVSYDAERHEEVKEEKDRLGRVAGRIEELEKRLEARPEIEHALTEAKAKIEESGKAAESLRREISALGFDEAEFDRVKERAAAAEERAARLRDAREQLGGEWKDADHRIERTKDELKRLKETERLASEKSAAAARMDEMDGLFTEFFKGLTARVRPALEHEASTLVRELTDGRYEKMEFDDNYRVKLLDRFDDSYAIERFSGGEADVASLSARVALSKIIAARGSEALGFVVLDEVFGALDAQRRRNVLLALDRLKKTFGQIFIISHVADVQESALLDELWTVEEDEEGKSTVRRQKFDLRGEPVELLASSS